MNEMIASLCLQIGGRALIVISAYERSRSREYVFLASLMDELDSTLLWDSIILPEGFNTQVENDSNTWRGMTPSF